MPNQMPAIDAWERLRLGEIKEENRSEFIAGIRQFLGIVENRRIFTKIHGKHSVPLIKQQQINSF
jgi:hypothetical protein